MEAGQKAILIRGEIIHPDDHVDQTGSGIPVDDARYTGSVESGADRPVVIAGIVMGQSNDLALPDPADPAPR